MTSSRLVLLFIVVLTGCPKDDVPVVDRDISVGDADLERDTSGPQPDMGPVPDVAQPTDSGPEADTGPDSGADMGEPLDPMGNSGTRLRQRFLEAEGGGRTWLGWWDTELETSCEFYEIPATGLRCRPNPSAAEPVVFADATCSQPLYLNQEVCDQGWAYKYQTSDFYRSTGTETTVATRYRLDRDLNCISEAVAVGDVHFVAELVPQADLVAGTYVDEPRSAGLSARYVEGEDGSRRFETAIDTNFDVPCHFFEDTGRCMPDVRAATDAEFADPGCTEPVLSLFMQDDAPEVVLVVRTEASCRTGRDYFVTGAPATTVYRDNGGNCEPVTPSASRSYFLVDRPIPITEFAPGTPMMQGSGPLFAEFYGDENGAPVSNPFRFRDGANTCTGYEVDGEDTIRCVDWDAAYNAADYYSDAACGVALSTAYCDELATTIMDFGEHSQCRIATLSSLADVLTAGAVHTTDVYRGTAGACSLVAADPRYTSYEQGPSVLNTLPTLTLITE